MIKEYLLNRSNTDVDVYLMGNREFVPNIELLMA